jgi:hypothetical protein
MASDADDEQEATASRHLPIACHASQMINADQLVTIIEEEARLVAGAIQFPDAPNLTADEKFEREAALCPMPRHGVLAKVIESAFWASLLEEEEVPTRVRLVYESPISPTGIVHQLVTPIPISPEALRQLSPAHGREGSLTWRENGDEAVLTGIRAREGGDGPALIISTPFTGVIDASWNMTRLCTLRCGEIRRASNSALPNVLTVVRYLEHVFGVMEPSYASHVVQHISRRSLGGSLWIAAENTPLNGLSVKYRVAPPDGGIRDRMEQLPFLLRSIAHLSAIDGATLVDARMQVLGFGAFVDLRDGLVDRLLPNGTTETVAASTIGGGRHRSAVEFCRLNEPSAALVVSQDDLISMVARPRGSERPHVAEIGSLGIDVGESARWLHP